MKEQLINFETAKLAKEKGFNEDTSNYYDSEHDGRVWCGNINRDGYKHKSYILAPTQSLLAKWLREKHRLDITSIPIIHNKDHIPSYFRTYKNSCTWMDCGQSDSFEQALEKGLIESLKLIK